MRHKQTDEHKLSYFSLKAILNTILRMENIGQIYHNHKIHERLKVSEYPFKQNKNALKNIKVLLYTHFYNISLNILRPTFFNITNLPFSHFPNIKKIRVKVGPKTNYFSYFMSSCTDRIAVFNIFFHWYLANQETNKTVPAIFFFSNIFWIIYF